MAKREYYYEEEYRRYPRRDTSPPYSSGGGSHRHRSRSNPPARDAIVRRPKSRSRRDSFSSDEDESYTIADRAYRSRSRSRGRRDDDDDDGPMAEAKQKLENTFTDSPAGLTASLLGAVVGGFVARGVSEHYAKQYNASGSTRHPPRTRSHERNRKIAMAAGALAGGLGANAIASKVEDSKVKGRAQQKAWEGKWGRERELPGYDDGRGHEHGGRSVSRGRDDGRIRMRDREREMDEDDYDFVYDDRDGRRGRSLDGRLVDRDTRRSVDGRYR